MRGMRKGRNAIPSGGGDWGKPAANRGTLSVDASTALLELSHLNSILQCGGEGGLDVQRMALVHRAEAYWRDRLNSATSKMADLDDKDVPQVRAISFSNRDSLPKTRSSRMMTSERSAGDVAQACADPTTPPPQGMLSDLDRQLELQNIVMELDAQQDIRATLVRLARRAKERMSLRRADRQREKWQRQKAVVFARACHKWHRACLFDALRLKRMMLRGWMRSADILSERCCAAAGKMSSVDDSVQLRRYFFGLKVWTEAARFLRTTKGERSKQLGELCRHSGKDVWLNEVDMQSAVLHSFRVEVMSNALFFLLGTRSLFCLRAYAEYRRRKHVSEAQSTCHRRSCLMRRHWRSWRRQWALKELSRRHLHRQLRPVLECFKACVEAGLAAREAARRPPPRKLPILPLYCRPIHHPGDDEDYSESLLSPQIHYSEPQRLGAASAEDQPRQPEPVFNSRQPDEAADGDCEKRRSSDATASAYTGRVSGEKCELQLEAMVVPIPKSSVVQEVTIVDQCSSVESLGQARQLSPSDIPVFVPKGHRPLSPEASPQHERWGSQDGDEEKLLMISTGQSLIRSILEEELGYDALKHSPSAAVSSGHDSGRDGHDSGRDGHDPGRDGHDSGRGYGCMDSDDAPQQDTTETVELAVDTMDPNEQLAQPEMAQTETQVDGDPPHVNEKPPRADGDPRYVDGDVDEEPHQILSHYQGCDVTVATANDVTVATANDAYQTVIQNEPDGLEPSRDDRGVSREISSAESVNQGTDRETFESVNTTGEHFLQTPAAVVADSLDELLARAGIEKSSLVVYPFRRPRNTSECTMLLFGDPVDPNAVPPSAFAQAGARGLHSLRRARVPQLKKHV